MKTNIIITALIAFLISITFIGFSQVADQVAVTDQGVTKIIYPQGAAYSGTGVESGAIAIQLPHLGKGSMLKMRVEVYNHVSDESFTIHLAGRAHEVNGWRNCSAQLLSSNTSHIPVVRFGNNGSNAIIWIGELSASWNFLKVQISELTIGHSGTNIGNWDNNWSVGLEKVQFHTVDRTVTNLLPFGQVKNEEVTPLQIAQNSNQVTRIAFPKGAAFSDGSHVIGAIKIQLPQSYTGTRLRMRIEVFNSYNTADVKRLTYWISGRNDGGGWNNCSAQLLTTSSDYPTETHFGNDGTHSFIILGDENSTWHFPKVIVSEILLGHTLYQIDRWDNDWIITRETTAAMGIDQTVTNLLPLAQSDNAWQTNGANTVFFNVGNVGIGTSSPQTALAVEGEIRANKVRVMNDISGADFVFEPDYDLPTLPEVEQFIKTNKHLPEIPSAKEMQQKGLDLAEMNIKLLQKVEELTLYVIEQEKRLLEYEKQIVYLKSEVGKLRRN